ncbi:hypothetical protein GCM10027405_22880 [Arthrobacter alkaliphilus]
MKYGSPTAKATHNSTARMTYNRHLGLNGRVLFPCPRILNMAPRQKLRLHICYVMPTMFLHDATRV